MEVSKQAMEALLADYAHRTAKSRTAMEKRLECVLPGGDTRTSTYFAPYPLVLTRGQDDLVEDADGNQYIDMQNNYTSLVHGHTLKDGLVHLSDSEFAFGGPTIHQADLASVICDRVATVERVRFVNSGSEATDLAVQLARAFTKRSWIIRIEGGYHGSHLIARMGAPGEETSADDLERHQVALIPFNDASALEQALSALQGRCAAVLVEPVLGAAGTIPPLGSYLKDLEGLCRRFGVLLILDEVQMFRLSFGGAQELWDVRPDITAFGKVIGGGMPVGAVGGSRQIMEVMNPKHSGSLHSGGTFNGNPLSMIMGQIALEKLTPAAIATINQRADYIVLGMEKIISAKGLPAQVTQAGSIFNVHWTTDPVLDYRSALSASLSLKRYFHLAMLLGGVFMAARGMFNVSTALTEDHATQVLSVFEDVASEISRLV